jgi:hypothetical protein
MGERRIRAKSPYVDVKGVLQILNSLYPNKAFALVRENLQNSIDAKARNIWIKFDPAEHKASFVDDGEGIPVARMNEREYFALMWSTKRGRNLIGSKGIGRLTNIAAAKSVFVETNDGHRRATFTWHSNGSFSKHRYAPPTLPHRGLSLTLRGLRSIVAQDLPKKVDEVASDVFDDYLHKGVAVWLNDIQIRPKEYRGQRWKFKLKSGGDLHLYWSRDGQLPEDRGIVMKCRGVRVGPNTRFGIESEEWPNVAGVLHLDHLTLTANRDSFEDTEDFRDSITEAISKVRASLARYEGGRKQRLDEMAEQYTKAALEAAESLGIDLALLGPPGARHGVEAMESGNPGDGHREISGEPAERERPPSRKRKEGDDPGFRLIPRKFEADDELRPYTNDMTYRKGPVIFVNLSHPACPENRFARSFYIWCCAFVEIVKWGGLSSAEDLPRDRLLASYKGWLQRWDPALARFTAGAD